MANQSSQPVSKKSRFANATNKYTKFPTMLIRTPVLNSTEKVLLLYIGSMAECFASHKAMATICGVSVSSVQRSLKKLQSRGLVAIKNRGKTTCLYSIPHRSEWNLAEQLDHVSVTVTEGSGQGD